MADADLITEISKDPAGRGYATLTTDEAVHARLIEEDIAIPYTRFISLRACANVLDDDEYTAFKTFLGTVEAMGARQADMVAMLKLPCGDDGATGGLDFGCDAVRTLIDAFGAAGNATAAAKLKGLAERIVSRNTQLGKSWRLLDVIRARRAING